VRAFLAALLAAGAASAWEPASPAEVQSRIGELTQAWAGKTSDQVAQDKAGRARQKRPAWVDKGAWKLEFGPLTYYFAVGKAAFGAATAAAPAEKAPGNGRALDWWFDESAGALYTLVVEAR
jgi:hypothetical protein